jgi:uncharacterized protein (TIGR00661 family)
LKEIKKVLIAPLSWGLGHASRSVPIIKELENKGIEVYVASDSEALQYLKNKFHDLQFFELPPYNVQYKYSNMFFNILLQVPKILKAIYQERILIKDIIQKNNIDLLISDNRYGIISKKIPSVFITHQLNIKIKIPIIQKIVNLINHRLIRRYKFIWVPDFEEIDNLSGSLGHQFKSNKLRYIGPLSRLKNKSENTDSFDIVAVLSGPEPQRTYFEEELIKQIRDLPLKSLVIQGKLDKNLKTIEFDNLTILPFADDEQLVSYIKNAELLICRSGYSTIMDLHSIGVKQLLFVPTPGQTEQEYLADRFSKNKQVIVQEQSKLDVKKAWENRSQSKGFEANPDNNLLKAAIEELLHKN